MTGPYDMKKEELLRNLPSVDRLTGHEKCGELIAVYGRGRVVNIARKLIDKTRSEILSEKNVSGNTIRTDSEWLVAMEQAIAMESIPALKRVVNCSGVVVHTNLGRAALCDAASDATALCARSAVNIEYDIVNGTRGDRDTIVESLVTELTGAQAATVVNNNAAAVLLALNTLSDGKETIVSRGELIEIGGSFRLPEIMSKSGCVLREVGTTNKTSLQDYAESVNENTGLILRAHTSNYRIIGFTSQPGLDELASLSRSRGVPLMYDLGSGTLIDLRRFGLPHEPTVQETIEQGADVVTISCDKLLGGPQAGIIAGAKETIGKIKKNHLKRALRCDKMTFAALETTLRLYLNPDEAVSKIPTLRHLSKTIDQIRPVAQKAAAFFREYLGSDAAVSVVDDVSRAGSGSLPQIDIPTLSVAIKHGGMGPNDLAAWFRNLDTPIIGRVEDDLFRMDMRCVDDVDDLGLTK